MNEIFPKRQQNLCLSKRNAEGLLQIIEKSNNVQSKTAVLSGYFRKSQFSSLKHSVAIGDNGGFYALLNKIDDDKMIMLCETSQSVWII